MTRASHSPLFSGEARAIECARKVMREHSINISLPWEGDLDDLEQDKYVGLVLACRAYSASLSEDAAPESRQP